MKTFSTFFAFLLCISLSHAQHSETRKIQPHNAISVSTGIEVDYIRSDRNEAIIETEKAETAQLLLTEVKNGKLSIQYKPNSKIKTNKKTKVTVYSNSTIKEASASASGDLEFESPIQAESISFSTSSSGKISAEKVKANSISINTSSSSDIDLHVETAQLNINASSSGKIEIEGAATTVKVNMSSSAKIDLEDVKISNLTINGNSSAALEFNTCDTLNVELSSSAKVKYITLPKNIASKKLSSSGSLSKK